MVNNFTNIKKTTNNLSSFTWPNHFTEERFWAHAPSLTRQVPLVKQELSIFRSTWIRPGFSGVRFTWTFFLCACCVDVVWSVGHCVVCISVKGIEFASFYCIFIGFCKCSESGVLFFFIGCCKCSESGVMFFFIGCCKCSESGVLFLLSFYSFWHEVRTHRIIQRQFT